jgi:sugar phosphate permease
MINSSEGFSKALLGSFDLTFLFCYAAGLYISGHIEDKLAMRIVMPLGMLGSAVMIFLMSLMGFLGVDAAWPFFIFWAFNGFFQSVV